MLDVVFGLLSCDRGKRLMFSKDYGCLYGVMESTYTVLAGPATCTQAHASGGLGRGNGKIHEFRGLDMQGIDFLTWIAGMLT